MANSRQRRDTFEDVSSYTSNNAYRKNQKKKKRTGLKVFLGILFTLLILVGAGFLYVSTYLLGDLTTTSITKNKEELGISSNTVTVEGVTNIALFGVDSRSTDGPMTGNSDAIMVLTLDSVHNKVKLTSIMRDARVYMGDYTSYDGGYNKITEAYGLGGPEASIRVINQNYGLDIEDYVTVNFSGMAQIVDAFGGVDIEITDGEISELNGNLAELDAIYGGMTPYTGSAGMAHLDGNQAVAYGRIRNIGDDNGRVERQQNVLSALLANAGSISALEYPNLVRQLAPLCETSLGMDKMLSFAQFALSGFSIERLSIPSDIEGFAGGYFGPDEKWMWDYDTELAGEHIWQFIRETEPLNTTE